MAILLQQLMASNVSTLVATGLGLAVCALTVAVIAFTGDPKPDA
jgi:hypothetical protein